MKGDDPMGNLKNIARDYEHSRRGAVIRITRKDMCWFRRLISMYMNQTKFNQLLSQDELIMKEMVLYTDKGIEKLIKVLAKRGDVYTIEYSSNRRQKSGRSFVIVKDSFTVEYNARTKGLNFIQSNWNNQSSDLYEQASRNCENAIMLIYFLFVTNSEISDGLPHKLERFGMLGFSPAELVDGKKGTA